MNFYNRWVLPPVLDFVMRQDQLAKYRREAVAAATGRVLEIGVGSGLNFPFYGRQVEVVFGIDPSPRLLAIARRRGRNPSLPYPGIGDSYPASRQHGGRGRDDLDALFDSGAADSVT